MGTSLGGLQPDLRVHPTTQGQCRGLGDPERCRGRERQLNGPTMPRLHRPRSSAARAPVSRFQRSLKVFATSSLSQRKSETSRKTKANHHCPITQEPKGNEGRQSRTISAQHPDPGPVSVQELRTPHSKALWRKRWKKARRRARGGRNDKL